ncbi:MAG: TetR/AcrR family transcriptional regulator [Ignavibacteriales bacterium]|nr:TetR/AcrR family transcriptional regulator [Ignavibacteriales bacterium]
MSDLEIKKRILDTAGEYFYRFGVSKVTMEELADKLGMSKKTLYKYFESKDHLLRALIDSIKQDLEQRSQKILADDSIDFIEKLKQTMSCVAMQYSKIGKPLLEDLQRNAPEIWKQIEELRRERIANGFGKMLSEGRRRGIFRNDIDEQLVLMIYSNIIQNIINPDVLVQVPFSASQVFDAVIKIYYEGIMTEEGRAQFLKRDTSKKERFTDTTAAFTEKQQSV